MELEEAHLLLHQVGSKNFNKDGIAIEWHPLIVEYDMEQDILEVGFIAAYYLYDENFWGEGALSYVTDGTDSQG